MKKTERMPTHTLLMSVTPLLRKIQLAASLTSPNDVVENALPSQMYQIITQSNLQYLDSVLYLKCNAGDSIHHKYYNTT